MPRAAHRSPPAGRGRACRAAAAFRASRRRPSRRVGGALDGVAVDGDPLAGAVPRAVARAVVEDGEQPGPQIRSRLEAVRRAERFEICVLHEVFGIRGHPRQPQRRPVEAVERGQRLGLERRVSGGLRRPPSPPVWPLACPCRSGAPQRKPWRALHYSSLCSPIRARLWLGRPSRGGCRAERGWEGSPALRVADSEARACLSPGAVTGGIHGRTRAHADRHDKGQTAQHTVCRAPAAR